MRITVHLPESLEKDIKTVSQNEKTSVSSLVTKAVNFYLKEKHKKEKINMFLDLINKNIVSDDAEEEIEKERIDCDSRF